MKRASSARTGEAFLRDLAERHDTGALEVLWRAHEPGLCARLLPHIGATGDTKLGSLVLDEYLAPTMAAPVPETILRAASSDTPPRLSKEDAGHLVERLRAEQPRQGRFPPARVHVERWALAQDAPIVLEFASEVVTGDTAYSGDQGVLDHARRRVRDNRKLADAAATRLRERLAAERGQALWARALGFLEHLAPDHTSEPITQLTALVVDLAPGFAQAQFHQNLIRRLAGDPHSVERRLAQGRVQSGGAGSSFIAVIDAVESAEIRGTMTALVVVKNPELYQPLRVGATRWPDDEWAIRLTGLARAAPTQPTQQLVDLLAQAPHVHAPLIMRVSAQHGAPANDAIREAAAKKVAARLGELTSSGMTAEATSALAWPSSPDDPILAMAQAILNKHSQIRAVLVGEAIAQDLVPPAVAPLLIDRSGYAGILAPGDLVGERLATTARALFEAAPDHMHNVIRQTQCKGYHIELTRAVADLSPEGAFAGAAAVYGELSDGIRDELLELLENHGGWKQEDLIAAIAGDTAARSAARRIRAIRMAGRVAPRDGSAPPFYAVAAGTSRRDVREATFEAIAATRPRDAELARRLREVAEAKGAPGRDVADAALTTLATAYIQALEDATTHGGRQDMLALLGATARPDAIDSILRYLGGEAEDDHPDVKRAAALALLEAVRYTQFSVEQLSRVGDFLHGPEPEGDPEARELLSSVLARAILGEDQAAALLYELVGISPKEQPSALFGAEKEPLLTAAGLYEKSRNLGEAGWPGMIQQLDIMAMCLARAAYLIYGDNEGTKETIWRDPQRPDWGSLVNQLSGPLSKAKGPLMTLHELRGAETQYSHPGTKPTQDTVTTVHKTFADGAKVLLGNLVKAATKDTPD